MSAAFAWHCDVACPPGVAMNFVLFVSTDPLGVKIVHGKPDMVTAVDGANPLGMLYLQVRRTFPLDVTTFMFGLVDNTKLGVKMVHSIGSSRLFNTIAARVSAAKTAVVVTKDSSMEGKSTDIIFIESSFLSRDSPDGRL